MKLKEELYDVLISGVENGIEDAEKFTYAVEDAAKVIELIIKYCKKSKFALECGGEWMFQNDDAQVDALDLVSDILDTLGSYSDYEGEDDE